MRKIKNVELWYPGVEGNFNAIEIDLICVRASDGILVEYDFDRDGWVISQPTVLEWEVGDEKCDPCYKEAAFVRSWQLNEDAKNE